MGMFEIPSSRPEHFANAIVEAERISNACTADHPLHAWLTAARTMAAGPHHLEWPDDAAMEAWLEGTLFPATMLCRLARSLRDVSLLGGSAAEEVGKMSQPVHFAHSEYALHVAIKIAVTAEVDVRFVATSSGKRPDLEIESEQYLVECRARTTRSAQHPLRHDFEHAREKANDYYRDAPSRQWWPCLVATDMGFCGSPELPNIGRGGPTIAAATSDAEANFGLPVNAALNGVLITWTSLRIDNGYLHPVDVSGLLPRTGTAWSAMPASLTTTFHEWDRQPAQAAIRTR